MNWCTAAAVCWLAKAWCTTARLLVAAEIREIEGKDKELNTLLSLATAIEERLVARTFPRGYGDRFAGFL